ncbi:MAG TPA: hypothetical protein VE053_09065 [Allosphingosinicella sp.]|nr:hypothetical protein [Allosphingosinicella sp.]
MDDQGLPGLRAHYEFVPAGEAVELRLGLLFDPAEIDLDQTVRSLWLELRDRLVGGTGDKLPPVPVSLVTSLASEPITVTADGGPLREKFASFAGEVAALPDRSRYPVVAELIFTLPRTGVKALPGDVRPVEALLEIGGRRLAVSPRLDEDAGVRAYAARFEKAWQGFDGGTGRLALAEQGPEAPAYWYVRTGPAGGISLARPEPAEFTNHALAPFATVPLSGTVEQADGAQEMFSAIDLDSWWDSFATAFERLAATDGARERLAGIRPRLAGAMAARLVPISETSAVDGVEALRAACEEALAADLRSRPLVISAAVDVSLGEGAAGGPAAVLKGHAFSPVGSLAAGGGSSAAVRLEAGRRTLAFAAPAPLEGSARHDFSVRFEGERIELEGAPPLDLILHASTGTDDFAVDFGPQSVPVPLIGLPAAPVFSAAAAKGPENPETLGEALAWTVEIEISAEPAERDRLALAIAFDEQAEPISPSSPTCSEALFTALGRAFRLSAGLPAKPGPDSIARFAGLAEAVADALPLWRAPAPDVPELPGRWRYEFDWGDRPTLRVAREASGSAPPPPWPTVAGYGLADGTGATARYQPEAGAAAGAGLRIAVPGFRLLTDRAVRIHGRVIRNEGAAGPPFVYHSAIASSQPLAPCPEWQAPRAEPAAASLASALGAILTKIDEDPKRPYALGLETMLVRRLETAGEAALETRIPLVSVPRVTVGGPEGVAIADLTREIAGSLASARAGMGPGSAGEEVALTLALFDEAPAHTPLARLSVRIPVPGDDAWWGGAA